MKLQRGHNVSVHSHRFGGKEFLFGSAEIGHMHKGGIVDIPFPRAVRNALLAAGLAEQHRWVPNSGWITFRMHNEEALSHALWLMRLSYIRYALKTVFRRNSRFHSDLLENLSERVDFAASFDD